MGKSASSRYYKSHPEARRKKQAYDAELNKRPDQVKKRVALNKFNRKATKAGRNKKGDQKDASHQGGRITGYVSQSRNRSDRNNSVGDKNSRGGKMKFGRRSR